MTAPSAIHCTAPATLKWALARYGAVMDMADIKDIHKGIHEQTWRDGVKAGRYPRPIARGKWSTEQVVAAIFDQKGQSDASPANDPFDCYPLHRDISEDEHRPGNRTQVVLFSPRSKTSPR